MAPGRDLLALGIEGPCKPLLRVHHSDHSLGKRYSVTCSVTPSVSPLQTDSLPTVGERLINPLAFEMRKSDFKSSFGRGDAQICAPSFRWSAREPRFGRFGTCTLVSGVQLKAGESHLQSEAGPLWVPASNTRKGGGVRGSQFEEPPPNLGAPIPGPSRFGYTPLALKFEGIFQLPPLGEVMDRTPEFQDTPTSCIAGSYP